MGFGICGFANTVDTLSAIKYATVKPIRDEDGYIYDYETIGEYPCLLYTSVKAEKNQVTQAIELEEKAESKYLAVAVSSIIARNLFLQNLERCV